MSQWIVVPDENGDQHVICLDTLPALLAELNPLRVVREAVEKACEALSDVPR